MSYYSSSGSYGGDEEKEEELFRFDTSLVGSLESLNLWKQHLHTHPSIFDYLESEKQILSRDNSIFSCGSQTRAVAFTRALSQGGFEAICQKYKNVYAKAADPQFDIVKQIGKLDAQLCVLVKYLQQVEGNTFLALASELNQKDVSNIYSNLQKCVECCFDLNTLWLAMLTPKMFREENKGSMYKANYGGTLLFYQKELLYFQDRVKKAQIQNFSIDPKSPEQLLRTIGSIISCQKLKPNLKSKVISLLKGQHYARMQKNLKEEFIVASLSLYHGEEVSEIWDCQRYQELCILTLKQSFHNLDYLDCMLYMEPENIEPQRRTRTLEFANIYYSLIQRIINLSQDPEVKPNEITDNEIPLSFIESIMGKHHAHLVGHIIVNFLLSNKNAFSENCPELDKPLFGLLEGVKTIYLSFGTKKWLMPFSVLSAFTQRFFSKFSENLKPQIVSALPMMVINLGEEVKSTCPRIRQKIDNDKQLYVNQETVSNTEHLIAIYYFIKDAEDKDDDFYLDLPQVTPINFETALLFVKTLELKLKHHEPTEDQKKLWSMIIEECINEYKIKVNLKWFKPKRVVEAWERQMQFMFHREIKVKWAFDYLQQLLNFRDFRKFESVVENYDSTIPSEEQIIPYFKYAVGLDLNLQRISAWIREEEIFSLLNRMRSILEINFGDIDKMSAQQLVTLNELHLCLCLYNTKVQEAPGNEIYLLIVEKIVVSWVQNQDNEFYKKFQTMFPHFFLRFILKENVGAIGNALINLVASQKWQQENLFDKLQFFQEIYSQSIPNLSVQTSAQIISGLCSLTNEKMSVKILMSITQLIKKCMKVQPELKDYISIGIILDQLMTPEKIQNFLQEFIRMDENITKQLVMLTVQMLPMCFNNSSIKRVCDILKGYIDSLEDGNDPDKLLKVLDSIKPTKNELFLHILKAFVAQRKLDRASQSNSQIDPKVLEECNSYWSCLQKYVDESPNERGSNQETNLSVATQAFQETVLKKLKEDYKRVIHLENKGKLLKKKSTIQMKKENSQKSEKEKGTQTLANDPEDVSNDQNLKKARIWRKTVRKLGTFEDIIVFGEDPFEIGCFNEEQIYNECLKVIQSKNIQQKYLKRIIRKLPILKKCAQDIVVKMRKEAEEKTLSIQPEILCKLIMINSRYRSSIVEEYILENISKIPISIQIYQNYLAVDVKKKLQNIPKDCVSRMLYSQLEESTLKKVDQVFDSIIYLPIKKFEGVPLQFENKIQEKEGENQQWKTESQFSSDDAEPSEEEITEKKQKVNKKEKQEQEDKNEQQDDWEDAEKDEEGSISQGGSSSLSLDEQSSGSYDQDQINQDQHRTKIAEMFYTQNSELLPKYKMFIKLREELNVAFEDNYLSYDKLKQKVSAQPELGKKISEIVHLIETFFAEEQEIMSNILNKIPANLYKLLVDEGLKNKRNNDEIEKYRKQKIGMPHFLKDHLEERDGNSEGAEEEYMTEDEYMEDSDELSEESDSIGDNFDMLPDAFVFAISEDGQLAHINVADLMKEEINDSDEDEPETEEIRVVEKLQEDANEVFTLPNLKQINSQIESQLTGKELGPEQIAKIIEISIIKLFSYRSYQLKQKPVFEFYRHLINSKHGKVFVDTLLTVLRVDEMYSQVKRVELAKRFHKQQLSLTNALSNFLEIAFDIASQESTEGNAFCNLLRNETQVFLPVGEQVLIKSQIPMQDKFLTMLVFYSRFSKSNIHEKAKKLISTIGEQKSYQLKKSKAAVITKHIYKNKNYSSIWNTMEDSFRVNIDMKTKIYSCLSVYSKLLREDIEKCYHNLIDNIKVPEGEDKQLEIKQQEKKVEQNLRKHFKRIKHFYYWNKRTIISEMDKKDKKHMSLLKNNKLIKLTELMIFYCRFIKDNFNEKIEEKAMKNLLLLPKSIIEISFMFLWKLQAKIDNWQPLAKVKQYFKMYKLYEHKFNRLEEVSNLILEFLDLPDFSNPKFKQIIIPYFIRNPENAHQIPLMFKLPDQELDGQKLFLTRECSFDMAFYQLTHNSFTIEFHNEEGSDHGGMVRQLMIGWNGIGIGQEHVFIGKILAFSFRKSVPYGGHFDIAMAIAITQFQVTLDFLKKVQPEVYNSLKYVKDSDPQDLDMMFQITKQHMGQIKHYPLIPNGSETAVTNQNKEQYIRLFLDNYFRVGRQWEMQQLCTGFFSSVNKSYAAIFHPLEMIQKIQGEQINDYTKLMKKTKYAEGYTESSQMIKWFWEVVAAFDQKQMNKFLQFITGAPKVSIYNHNFSFVVEKPYAEDESRLPVAHTCFNTLELPEYKTKQILELKMKQAIFEGNDNFGIL